MLRQLLQDIPCVISDRIRLAALELRRARHALIAILVFAAAGSVLAISAWLLLWALLIFVGAAQGVPHIWMLALAVVVNGLGAWVLFARIRERVEELALPATMRHLTVTRPDGEPAEAEDAA